jgi:hypothetical protein
MRISGSSILGPTGAVTLSAGLTLVAFVTYGSTSPGSQRSSFSVSFKY